MYSGELPLKMRRNVSFAAQEAGAESAEHAIRQAAPINKRHRKKKVLVITSSANLSMR
jgi:hypothetical protein